MKNVILSICILGLIPWAGCGELEPEYGASGNFVPANVQAIFDVHCIHCHSGSSAPVGQRLDSVNAYAAIVNRASVEVPSQKRITPNDPTNSYLFRKIIGDAGIVGDRMPQDGPPYLTNAQIDTIRQWILAGAPERL